MTAAPASDAAKRIALALQEARVIYFRAQPDAKFTLGMAAAAIRAQLAVEFPAKAKRAKSAACTPPLPSEVTAYFFEIGYPLDGEAWCDTYAQKGWLVGRTPMKDWRAACRNWKRHGWKIETVVAQEAGMSASLGALQIQIQTIEDELSRILYPGGAAFKTIPVGKDLERANFLSDQRKKLKARIETAS